MMIDAPWALEKVLGEKLTEDQLHDLRIYLENLHDHAWDEGYERGARDRDSEIIDSYREGYHEAEKATEDYWRDRLEGEVAGAYHDGLYDGYSQGYEAGTDLL